MLILFVTDKIDMGVGKGWTGLSGDVYGISHLNAILFQGNSINARHIRGCLKLEVHAVVISGSHDGTGAGSWPD